MMYGLGIHHATAAVQAATQVTPNIAIRNGVVGYFLMGVITCGGLFKLMQHMQANPECWSQ